MGVHGPVRLVAVWRMPCVQVNAILDPLNVLLIVMLGGGVSRLTNCSCAPLMSASVLGSCVGTGEVGPTSTFRVPPDTWTLVNTTKLAPSASAVAGAALIV